MQRHGFRVYALGFRVWRFRGLGVYGLGIRLLRDIPNNGYSNG